MMYRSSLLVAALVIGWGLLVGFPVLAVEEREAESESEGVASAEVTPPLMVAIASQSTPPQQPTPSLTPSPETSQADAEVAWDYDPYRILVWLVSDNPSFNAARLETRLRSYLDRDFSAVWRFDFADAPAAIRIPAIRDIEKLSYDSITAADPVLAVKRDHPDAVRIRTAKNAGEFVKKVYATDALIREAKQRGASIGNPTLDGIESKLEGIAGDAMAVRQRWSDGQTEALLVSRGIAMTLSSPEAKIIPPAIDGLVGEIIEGYDKVFIARIKSERFPIEVSVVEFDTLMRHFGPVAHTQASSERLLPVALGQGLTSAFAPVVRIENAGQRNAVGLLRAGGLILERDRETSPAFVRVGDVLEPMVRKDDRNGSPILIGPMDWAFLLVKDLTGHNERNVEMDFHAGRAGSLQGRKNSRTFRMALKARTFGDSTMLRLHLQKNPKFPLIGYELYDKELDSTSMTFIGRTDWNGRLLIERSEQPLRLLYVKNGGAVLARLPIVPGLYPQVVADLSGDDLRLQAEAYIRGVQNSIIDLVAIRELFKARIELRLEQGEIKKAEELLNALRDQPSSEKLYDEIGKRHSAFINELGSGNTVQRRKIDEMFSTTRELLARHITPKLVRDLEAEMLAATQNGGRTPQRVTDSDPQQESPEDAASEADAEATDEPASNAQAVSSS